MMLRREFLQTSALALAGLGPFVGLGALLLFWRSAPQAPAVPPVADGHRIAIPGSVSSPQRGGGE